jgi:hypothetical protein
MLVGPVIIGFVALMVVPFLIARSRGWGDGDEDE